jgi:hypothetical protein
VRTLDQIRQDLDRARSKRDELKDDVDRIYATNGRELDSGQAERVENLVRGITAANHEIESLEDEIRDELAEGLRSGRYSTDPAWPDDDQRGESRGYGDPRVQRLRSDALRANERASFLPDESKAKMERTLRTDDDPEGLLARYTVETANRDYFRAFSSWMRDPVSGGHEWSPKERDAVKRVRSLERAMAIGTGGAGGSLLPYELDPAILISGTGPSHRSASSLATRSPRSTRSGS